MKENVTGNFKDTCNSENSATLYVMEQDSNWDIISVIESFRGNKEAMKDVEDKLNCQGICDGDKGTFMLCFNDFQHTGD